MRKLFLWISLVVALIVFTLSISTQAQGNIGFGWHVYETPNYWIVITETCHEGDIECDATYAGTNKQNGSSILLKGKTALRMCNNNPDTPCGVDGLDFTSGSVDYLFVTNGGLKLIVTIKGKPTLREDAKLVTEGDGLSGVTYPTGSKNN